MGELYLLHYLTVLAFPYWRKSCA